MAARKKKKAKRVVNTTGKTGYIVVHNETYDVQRPSWQLNGTDIHSTLKGAQDCCGGAGEEYGILEVVLVAQHSSVTVMNAGDVKIKLNS